MRVAVSSLLGAALDWAVERALGTHWSTNGYFVFKDPERFDSKPEWRYSTDWSHGGPIIEREGITHGPWDTSPFMAHIGMTPMVNSTNPRFVGPTPLIAAMRCFVASKMGAEIDVPDDIC